MAGIYVHIPFCKQRCIYCDFYSTELHPLMDDYVEAVICEAKLRPLTQVKTLYLGGGTPSQLSCDQIKKLVEGLRRAYDLSQVAEFTVEVNPDDVNDGYVRHLVGLGVNRISMGVQSFVDRELRTVNRRHDAKGALDAIACIRRAGIDNISIDLIYGIPGQSIESWEQSVDVALSVRPQHLSAYNLSYERGTRLWHMRESGQVQEIDDNTCVQMYCLLNKKLKEAGYVHYEISNYCLPDMQSRHNSSYWDGTEYVGLGASAHSYVNGVRSYNPPSIKQYISSLQQGHLVCECEETEWWERYDELIMVSLRTARGVSINKVRTLFGQEVVDSLLLKAQVFLQSSQLVLDGDRLLIPENELMMSDAIIRDLMWD